MPMIEELEVSGNRLFRWRSYLPLLLVILIIEAFHYFSYPFNSELLDNLWEVACILIGLAGLTIRGLTAGFAPTGTSGRNTKKQVADMLNTTGMYSVVRNPLYLGNFFVGLSAIAFLHVWWLSLIYLLLFVLYYERIIFAEEMFLRRKFGDAYIQWATQTPAFIPKLSLWRKPELAFSLRTVIRREYQSFYGLIVSLFLLEQAGEFFLNHGWSLDPMWLWIMASSTLFYVVCRFLHKRTTVLLDAGR